MNLINWLRTTCAGYKLQPIAVYRKDGNHPWPLNANGEDDLVQQLKRGGHFLPLPKEPAALANIVEVSLVNFLLKKLNDLNDVNAKRGTERGYPDIEISGEKFGNVHHALDVKVARRAKSRKQTQSRITLYTGNTYFRFPTLHWRGTFRPFDDYTTHLDLVVLYDLNEKSTSRVDDLQLIVHESWRIASRQRSSTTREYIGAVMSVDDLEKGRGEFKSKEEFYDYWRSYKFKIGPAVEQQLRKLMEQAGPAR